MNAVSVPVAAWIGARIVAAEMGASCDCAAPPEGEEVGDE